MEPNVFFFFFTSEQFQLKGLYMLRIPQLPR